MAVLYSPCISKKLHPYYVPDQVCMQALFVMVRYKQKDMSRHVSTRKPVLFSAFFIILNELFSFYYAVF